MHIHASDVNSYICSFMKWGTVKAPVRPLCFSLFGTAMWGKIKKYREFHSWKILGHYVDGVGLMEQKLHPHATNRFARFCSAAWAGLIQWDGLANPVRWEAPQRALSATSPLERCPTGHFMMFVQWQVMQNGRVSGGHRTALCPPAGYKVLGHTCIGQLRSSLVTLVFLNKC